MDHWPFGLLVTGNLVIVIACIDRIRKHGGIVWLDVTMWDKNGRSSIGNRMPELNLIFSPTDRTHASVRADAVIAAFELADT